MIATPCPPPASLRSLNTGQIDETDSDSLLDHIDQCDACRHTLQSIQDERDWLIDSLRTPRDEKNFENEPGYRSALARALGAIEHFDRDPEQPASDEKLPDQIGEYEIIRPLGRGGMGHVYLARHTKLGRDVALKLIASHRLGSPQAASRFEAEMRAVGRLSHPNIVTAHDAREVDGTAVLITEFIDGLDLAEILRNTGSLSISNACEIARTVAQALDYISKQGFVHRDVKPSNIMLASDGQIKLLDLGLARYLHHEDTAGMTGTGQIMGTIDYAAPEQITGSQTVDIRSDIYSLGCTLYHLLSGQPPFDSEQNQTPYAKMTAQVSQDPPSLAVAVPAAPASLVKLVSSMLAKDPNKRPASAMEVAQRLAPHCADHHLPALLTIAVEQEIAPSAPRKSTSNTNASAPKTSSFFQRPIPIWTAIAAGFFGICIGALLGIIITVTKPDGSKITMQVPDGSSIDIQESGDAPSAPVQLSENQPPSLTLSPMALAATVEAEDVDADELNRAISALREHEGAEPLETAIGIWCPLGDANINVSINATHNGKRYTLIRKDREAFIPWTEIVGNIGMNVQGQSQVMFSFNDTLADRVKVLTKKNLLGHLAVVVDKEIITAPKIVSPISNHAALTGIFDPKKLDYLRQALSGLVLEQPDESPSEESSEPVQDDREKTSMQVDRTVEYFTPFAHYLETRTNFERIGKALRQYHDVYGKLPGVKNTYRPVELDEDKVPLDAEIQPYSWRVALLPYLGHEELFFEYDFMQHWNDESNKNLLVKMPEIYRSQPVSGLSNEGTTPYLGIDEPGSAMGQPLTAIADGLSDTIFMFEADGQVPWIAPVDFRLGSPHEDYEDGQIVSVLFLDGRYSQLQAPVPENFRQLSLRNDGHPKRNDLKKPR